ncbi:nickel-responsive transcriptional regulator NikR [Rhodomicrobium lacus]|uniref:nickel-responsive transcriptional regulator NikR n=1 Tax=Rhodomicrobium lacus TaxID=2498452 RepID=UPI0026E26657|nr:nickel-responsive transcriptional regulator NikR [Rhodomicrobium lacus]WKW50416.1 nickel-responsive transcriptional regulator NikR [Rhodomicrobium lacus]
MERVTISLDEDLLGHFDRYLDKKGYASRSEAIRDLLRDRLEQEKLSEDKAENAIACLSYVYNHEQRELSRRLARTQHAHHHLVLSTLHVHLDYENCLEVALLKGNTHEVRRLAEATIAETGVRHGNLHIVPDDMPKRHDHD